MFVIKNMKIGSNLIKLRDFFRKVEIKPTYFILPAFLSLLAAILEGVSVASLIPLVKGVVAMDFGQVKDFAFFKFIFFLFPKIFTSGNTPIFMLLVAVIFFSVILKNILQYIAALCTSFQIRTASSTMRKIIFRRYLSFGKMFFDRNNVGHLYNVLLNYTINVSNRLVNFKDLISDSFMLAVYLTIMFFISWKLTMFTILLFPILSYSLKMLIVKIKNTSKFYAESCTLLSSKISNILSCIPLVKLYANEHTEDEHFSMLSENIKNVEFSMDKKNSLIAPLQEIIMYVAILLLVILMSFMAVREKSMQISSLLVYFYALRMAYRSFGIFNHLKSSLATSAGPISEISSILNDKEKFFIPAGQKKFFGLIKTIEIQHLTFFYTKDRQVLKDVSFVIEKGKMTAIVGPTGSGKTTLINLLLRFYDCQPASIMIDGDDIRDFNLQSLRSHMALVSQDTLLFNDTFKNNIGYGLGKDMPDEKIMDVIKKARLYDFISSLSDGINTHIGDRGVRLSGGEKQRVAIARALLKGSEILILDEATSALDTRTERFIQEAINEAIKDRTAIVIAHRLSTIKNADKIVVIDDGRIVEDGTLNELLERKGKFFEYWQEQKFY